VVKYTVGGVAQSDITMTANGSTYTATIPAKAAGSVVAYTVSATNAGGTTNTTSASYTVAKSAAPVIDNIALAPSSSQTTDDSVTVSAEVTNESPATISTVKLTYKPTSGSETTVDMSKTYTTYTYTIPKQSSAGTVTYTITATNSEGTTKSETGSYTVKAAVVAVDYTKLKLNEVNGVSGEKWFEIYNTGDVAINLENVKAYYNSGSSYALSWTGTSSQTIAAKGYFSTKGTTLNTGLSANNKDVKLQLRAPDEVVLDTYQKPTGIDLNSGYSIIDRAHARIPDGSGDWYYLANSTGTSSTTNGTSTTGCIKFGNEASAVLKPAETKLLILQAGAASGGAVANSFVELYNAGDTAVDLTGYSLQYADAQSSGIDKAWAKIDLSGSLPSHCSYLILGTYKTPSGNTFTITSTGDVNSSFTLNNDGFKVVLMSNQTLLTVANPSSSTAGYVDMLGAKNNYTPQGCEGSPFADLSKNKTARRKNLSDTDNNANDFTGIDYRTSGNSKYAPKKSTDGAYTPQF